ncbi:tetratricopeptide repeat protein [Thermodesulfobacteriota bacterium]
MTPDQVHERFFLNVRLSVWICLMLMVATLGVYGQVRNYAFVDYDDDLYVVENRRVQAGLTKEAMDWAFKTIDAANWHPLTWLSHQLDVQLYGMNPGAHHVTNLIFHIVNTILLFIAFRQISGALWRSAFVAALFALHPLHVESVAQVACRKDVLSTLFWILSMLSYAEYVKRSGVLRYLLVILFFVLGLMAKPMLVTLPFVLLLLDYWPFARFQTIGTDVAVGNTQHKKIFLHLIWEKVPLFIITAVSCAITFIVQNRSGAVSSLITVPLSARVANALVSYIRYIIKMIWPTHLAVFYPHPGRWPLWQVAGAFLFLVFVSILVIRPLKKQPYLIVGWLWYLGTLVPVIGLVQVGSQAMADRYTYVPLIGLFIMIAWGANDILKKWRYKRFVLTAIVSSILSILMVVTWMQASYWQNSIKLFTHAVAVTSDNLMAHNNLGFAFEKEGRAAEAIQHYLEVLKKDPNKANTHNNIGNALLSQGKIAAAKYHYSEALRLNPDHAQAHNNLGNVFSSQGNKEEAIQQYLKALEIVPDYKEAHYNLGNVFLSNGKLDKAIYNYFEALRINPFYAGAHNNLGVALAKQEKIAEATFHFQEALRLAPDYLEARDNLKEMGVAQGRLAQTILDLRQKLALNPKDAVTHYEIGNIFKRKGELDMAGDHYQKALSLQPGLVPALDGLASVHALKGEYDMSRTLFKKSIKLRPDRAAVYYYIAGTYARQNRIKESIDWLKRAVAKGFKDRELLENDKNLESIRETSYYKELMRNR